MYINTVHEAISDQSQMNVKVDEIQISAQRDLEQSNAVVFFNSDFDFIDFKVVLCHFYCSYIQINFIIVRYVIL